MARILGDQQRRAIASQSARAGVYELGGPEILSCRAVVESVLHWTRRQRLLLPFPFPGWYMLAAAAQALPAPRLTQGQVAFMKQDNVVGTGSKTLSDFGTVPQPIAEIAPAYLAGAN